MSDAALLQAWAGRRDEAAFSALVERHGAMVQGICQRLLGGHPGAEDAVQATFLVLARKAGVLADRGSVAPWLYTVCVRLARRAAADRRYWEARHQSADQVVDAVDDHPDQALARQELLAQLDQVLTKLPDRLRDPLILVYLQGLSHRQAAQALGIAPGSIARRLDQGLQALRRHLPARSSAMALCLPALPDVLCPPLSAAVASGCLSAAQGGAGPSVLTVASGGVSGVSAVAVLCTVVVTTALTAFALIPWITSADPAPADHGAVVVVADHAHPAAVPAAVPFQPWFEADLQRQVTLHLYRDTLAEAVAQLTAQVPIGVLVPPAEWRPASWHPEFTAKLVRGPLDQPLIDWQSGPVTVRTALEHLATSTGHVLTLDGDWARFSGPLGEPPPSPTWDLLGPDLAAQVAAGDPRAVPGLLERVAMLRVAAEGGGQDPLRQMLGEALRRCARDGDLPAAAQAWLDLWTTQAPQADGGSRLIAPPPPPPVPLDPAVVDRVWDMVRREAATEPPSTQNPQAFQLYDRTVNFWNEADHRLWLALLSGPEPTLTLTTALDRIAWLGKVSQPSVMLHVQPFGVLAGGPLKASVRGDPWWQVGLGLLARRVDDSDLRSAVLSLPRLPADFGDGGPGRDAAFWKRKQDALNNLATRLSLLAVLEAPSDLVEQRCADKDLLRAYYRTRTPAAEAHFRRQWPAQGLGALLEQGNMLHVLRLPDAQSLVTALLEHETGLRLRFVNIMIRSFPDLVRQHAVVAVTQGDASERGDGYALFEEVDLPPEQVLPLMSVGLQHRSPSVRQAAFRAWSRCAGLDTVLAQAVVLLHQAVPGQASGRIDGQQLRSVVRGSVHKRMRYQSTDTWNMYVPALMAYIEALDVVDRHYPEEMHHTGLGNLRQLLSSLPEAERVTLAPVSERLTVLLAEAMARRAARGPGAPSAVVPSPADVQAPQHATPGVDDF